MAAVGEIAITVGADIGPMVRELGKAKGQLNSFESGAARLGRALGSAFGIATISVGALSASVIALTRASMTNIDALSKQARAAGVSVSSFQAMAMVAGEAGVESDKLSKVLVKMQDNIAGLASGSKAQIQAFQDIGLSMSDLEGIGADEQFAKIAEKLSAISDPAKKTAAAINVFGKSGADAINMLDGYGAAVENAAEFQRQFGIAVTDTDARNIEAANDAMGRVGMLAEGVGNKLAALAAGPVATAAEAFLSLAGAVLGVQTASTELLNYIEILDRFGETDRVAAMAGSWMAFQEVVRRPDAMQAIEEMDAGYRDLYETVNRATSGMAGDINALAEASESLGEGVRMLSDRAEGLAIQLQQAINEGRVEDAARLKAELERTVEQLRLSLEGAQKLSGVDMSAAISWADQLAGAFGRVAAAAAAAASAVGQIYGMDTGSPLSGDVSGMMPPSVEGVSSSPRPKSAPNDPDFGLPPAAKGGGKKRGGGSADAMTRRVEALVESLQTEREILEAWYAESLELINTATEAELEALGGKHEAIQRLEEEHQKRLAQIREMGNQWGLEAALSGGAEIFQAMGAMNKKALKAASIFSAAQALISTYQGAAKELREGTYGQGCGSHRQGHGVYCGHQECRQRRWRRWRGWWRWICGCTAATRPDDELHRPERQVRLR